jgi:hypothetical protein
MSSAVPASGIVNSVIRITGIGDHDRPEWLIRINGICNWLQTYAGHDIPLDLTNMQMPCPVGGRASILSVRVCRGGGNGKRVHFSLLSHSTMNWLRICTSKDLEALSTERKPSPLMRIALLLMGCACPLAGLVWQLNPASFFEERHTVEMPTLNAD